MTATAYDRLIAALETNGSTVKTTGAQRSQAQCPAHDDRTPSLSVRGIDGAVLLHCFTGCDNVDVLAALNLGMADLFDEGRSGTYAGMRYDTYYRYNDQHTVYRSAAPKDFRQTKGSAGRSIYHLEKVEQAVRQGEPVYIVEGEKAPTAGR